MKAVVSALDHHKAFADVYKCVKDSATLNNHLGRNIKEGQIHIGEPTVAVSLLTATTQSLEFKD